MSLAALSLALGDRRDYLPFSEFHRAAPLSIGAELTSTWSVALVKTSVAVMLMRLRPTQGWTWFLYAVVGVQLLTAAFVTIMQTTRCIPIEALWEPTIAGKRCWGVAAFKASLTATSIIVIATDVVFALIPLTFLHHIRAAPSSRAAIGVLMSLGLFASAASVVKTYYVQTFDETGDVAGEGMSICLWASIEAQVGITAACVPCLRATFLRCLGRTHLRHTAPAPASLSSDHSSSPSERRPWQGRLRPISSTLRPNTGEPCGFGLSHTQAAARAVATQSDERILIPYYRETECKPSIKGTYNSTFDASMREEGSSPVDRPGQKPVL